MSTIHQSAQVFFIGAMLSACSGQLIYGADQRAQPFILLASFGFGCLAVGFWIMWKARRGELSSPPVGDDRKAGIVSRKIARRRGGGLQGLMRYLQSKIFRRSRPSRRDGS